MGLALSLSFGLLACGKSDTGTSEGTKSQGTNGSNTGTVTLSEPGVFPLVDKPAEISVATVQTAYYGDVPELFFTKWYEEKTGVKVNWELIPQAALSERLGLMMTNPDDLPDAIMGGDFSPADQVNYGSQNIFLPLQDYIQDVGHYANLAYDDALLNQITAPDGNIYALAGINACYHCFYSGKVYINQTWLDNLDLEYPETTEDLYNVLKAFKEQDANGNGDPNDEIPMMGAAEGWNTTVYDYLLGSFVYNDFGQRLALEDGKINFVADDEAFKEALLYIRKMVDEGLIDATSLTQTEDQYRQVAGDPTEVRVGVVTGATWWSGLGNDSEDPLQRSRQYVGLSPVEGPHGVRNALTSTSAAAPGKIVITKTAENPELVFRWAEGMLSDEVTMVSALGEKGLSWDDPDEGAIGINGKPALYKLLPPPAVAEGQAEAIRMDWMPNVAMANRTADFRLGQQIENTDEAKWDSEPRLYQITKDYFEAYGSDQAVPALMYEPDEASERASLQLDITTYTNQNIVNFLAGNRDIEADWDNYVAEFDKLKVDRLVELTQIAYDRQYGGK